MTGVEQQQSTNESVSAAPSCVHCGLGIPPRRAGSPYCCEGCRVAAEIIQENQLGEYYLLRDKVGADPTAASGKGHRYLHFDDEAFREEFSKQLDSGEQSVRLQLEGIHCAACLWLLEKLPRICSGVTHAQVSLETGTINVRYEDALPLSTIARTLDSLGYAVSPYLAQTQEQRRKRAARDLIIKVGIAAACAGNNMMMVVSLYQGQYTGIEEQFRVFLSWVSAGVTLPIVFYCALPFYRTGFGALRRGIFHLDLPISLAVILGFGISFFNVLVGRDVLYFDSISVLVFLVLAARLLQQSSLHAAQRKADLLVGFLSHSARRLNSAGAEEEVYVRSVEPGEVIIVRAEEVIPLDGEVSQGNAEINNAVVSGEPEAIKVSPGMSVLAGAKVESGELHVQVRKGWAESELQASISEARSETREDGSLGVSPSFVRLFVVLLLTLSVANAFAWGYWGSFNQAIDTTLAILIIACPCALALAIPLSFGRMQSESLRRGIFIRGVGELAALLDCSRVIFDKTGTLTTGDFQVTDVRIFHASWSLPRVAEIVAAMEQRGVHHVGRALRRWAEGNSSESQCSFSSIREHVGGVSAVNSRGEEFLLGSAVFAEQHGVTVDQSLSLEAGVGSLSFLVVDQEVVATFLLQDAPQPDLKNILNEIGSLAELQILTGDTLKAAEGLVRQLELPISFRARQLPSDKAQFVRERQEAGERVLYVGDGANDAQALQAANCGIGMHAGAQACLQSSGIYVSSARLSDVRDTILASKRLRRVSRTLIAFSVSYNLIGAGLAAAGFVTPLVAAIAMPLSSVTVIVLAQTWRPYG